MTIVPPNNFDNERSPHWESCANWFRTFKRQHGQFKCSFAGCEEEEHLDAHHLVPVKMWRVMRGTNDGGTIDLELSFRNLMLLCHEHHLRVGHLGDWHKVNERLVQGKLIIPSNDFSEYRDGGWVEENDLEQVIQYRKQVMKTKKHPGSAERLSVLMVMMSIDRRIAPTFSLLPPSMSHSLLILINDRAPLAEWSCAQHLFTQQ